VRLSPFELLPCGHPFPLIFSGKRTEALQKGEGRFHVRGSIHLPHTSCTSSHKLSIVEQSNTSRSRVLHRTVARTWVARVSPSCPMRASEPVVIPL
jgi:hypothetical protein